MNDDRRTKAQILSELESANKKIVELQQRIPETPRVVPVASALSGCIRALDAIPAPRARNSWDQNNGPDATEVAHVLRHLIHRYGVDLIERRTEPCARPHLEDATDTELIAQLRGFPGGF